MRSDKAFHTKDTKVYEADTYVDPSYCITTSQGTAATWIVFHYLVVLRDKIVDSAQASK